MKKFLFGFVAGVFFLLLLGVGLRVLGSRSRLSSEQRQEFFDRQSMLFEMVSRIDASGDEYPLSSNRAALVQQLPRHVHTITNDPSALDELFIFLRPTAESMRDVPVPIIVERPGKGVRNGSFVGFLRPTQVRWLSSNAVQSILSKNAGTAQ